MSSYLGGPALFIGEDTTRGGLQETPARVLAAWREWFGGYRADPAEILKSFVDGADKVDETSSA